jgi:hypothetical protein
MIRTKVLKVGSLPSRLKLIKLGIRAFILYASDIKIGVLSYSAKVKLVDHQLRGFPPKKDGAWMYWIFYSKR